MAIFRERANRSIRAGWYEILEGPSLCAGTTLGLVPVGPCAGAARPGRRQRPTTMPRAVEAENDSVLSSDLRSGALFDVSGKVVLVSGGASGIGRWSRRRDPCRVCAVCDSSAAAAAAAAAAASQSHLPATQLHTGVACSS
jgi:hypothetical protein